MNEIKLGDFVKTKDEKIGIVEWVENKCMNIKEEDGYLGINILTHTKGFAAPVKVETVKKSSIKEVIEYYESEQTRLRKAISEERIDKKELERLKNENELLKKTLKLYI
jgi:hypothetical protein